nr:eri1 exoribonuclease 2 [Hymenolepis microstoma]
MNPSSAANNVEQVLEKLFSKQIHENFERCCLLEKKIGVNVLMCENFINQFPVNSGTSKSTLKKADDGKFLCAQFCDELFHGNNGLGILNNLEHSKLDAYNNTNVSNLFVSSINESKSATKSEFARLASAKRLSDSLALELQCEEVRLKAEIDFFTRCLEDPLTDKNEYLDNNENIDNLMTECSRIKGNCLNFVKDLACSDHFETSRLRFERRKARQASYLDCQDRKIQEAQLTCSKLEIFGNIMALEDSALIEMTQCIDKIYAALKKYFQISIDIKSRFQNSKNSLQSRDYSDVIDFELKGLLISLLFDPSDISDTPETVSNETLLKNFEEKIGSLESKNTASLSTMKEFKLLLHEISLMLGKALQWLECSGDSEAQKQHVNPSESPCIYWNALGSFSGVIPHRLVKRLLQVRRELDDAFASLRKLELTFELNSEVL